MSLRGSVSCTPRMAPVHKCPLLSSSLSVRHPPIYLPTYLPTYHMQARMSSRSVPAWSITASGGLAAIIALLINLDSLWDFVSIVSVWGPGRGGGCALQGTGLPGGAVGKGERATGGY